MLEIVVENLGLLIAATIQTTSTMRLCQYRIVTFHHILTQILAYNSDIGLSCHGIRTG